MYLTIITIVFYLLALGIPLYVIFLMYKAKEKKEKNNWYDSKKNICLSILVPRNNEKKPVAAEQLFASIHGIFKDESKYQDQISFEIVAKDKFIQFYVYLPEYLRDFIEGQIYAQYPDVEIFEINDYAQENLDGFVAATTTLKLSKPDVYPIKTFANFEVDPLSGITSVLSKVEEGEQVWLQMIIRPVTDNWQLRGISHVAAIKSGKKMSNVSVLSGVAGFFIDLLKDAAKTLINPGGTSGGDSGGEAKLSGPQEEALKEIERKTTKLGFATKIRIVAIAKDEYAAKSKIDGIAGAFKQFSTTNLNSFLISGVKYGKTAKGYKKRGFSDDGFTLNTEELASIYHLPTTSVETPNIVWAGSKKGEPPANLPIVSSGSTEDLTILAKTNFRNHENVFGIKRRDRNLHMYIIGKTGAGKSTLLENMVIDDIKKGQGVAYIDPHGDAINHILEYIPEERMNDVIYFNPADREWPIGFNPLETVNPDLKNIVASGVVGIFKKIFGESWGPRLEYILRNAILAAIDYPNSTLLSVMRLLSDEDYRAKVIEKINDPVVKDFFVNEYNKYDPKFQREAVSPIQNKVGQFLSSSTIRNIVGQDKSTIDLFQAMNEGKIILIDLSIGKIGEDNSALLGAMLITKFQLAAMQRSAMKAEDRRDFYLYVDEFQNFATDSFAVILSEARKYKLNLTMTNQYISQMPEAVANAIFGNVGTMISFRVGAQDAGVLVNEYAPVFEENDLVNLSNYNIYIKMAIDGVTRPAFSAVTLPLAEQKTNIADRIIQSSREKYSRPIVEVEESIKNWNEELNKVKEDAEEKKRRENWEKMVSRLKAKGITPDETYKTKEQLEAEKKQIEEGIASPGKMNEEKTTSGNYYTFIDQKGEKWYIPNSQQDIDKNNEQKDDKKKDERKNNDDDKGEGGSVKLNSDIKSTNDKSKPENNKIKEMRSLNLIKDKLETRGDGLNQIKDKIVNDKVSDKTLLSIEELEDLIK